MTLWTTWSRSLHITWLLCLHVKIHFVSLKAYNVVKLKISLDLLFLCGCMIVWMPSIDNSRLSTGKTINVTVVDYLFNNLQYILHSYICGLYRPLQLNSRHFLRKSIIMYVLYIFEANLQLSCSDDRNFVSFPHRCLSLSIYRKLISRKHILGIFEAHLQPSCNADRQFVKIVRAAVKSLFKAVEWLLVAAFSSQNLRLLQPAISQRFCSASWSAFPALQQRCPFRKGMTPPLGWAEILIWWTRWNGNLWLPVQMI